MKIDLFLEMFCLKKCWSVYYNREGTYYSKYGIFIGNSKRCIKGSLKIFQYINVHSLYVILVPYPPGEEPQAQTGGISAGAIIGILIAIVVIVAAGILIGWFFINRSSSKSFDTTASPPTGSVGFDNALYAERTDDKAQIVA